MYMVYAFMDSQDSNIRQRCCFNRKIKRELYVPGANKAEHYAYQDWKKKQKQQQNCKLETRSKFSLINLMRFSIGFPK